MILLLCLLFRGERAVRKSSSSFDITAPPRQKNRIRMDGMDEPTADEKVVNNECGGTKIMKARARSCENTWYCFYY